MDGSSGAAARPPALLLLERYTLERKALLQRLLVLSAPFVPSLEDFAGHLAAALAAALIFILVLSVSHGLLLFVFHPIFMNFAMLFMGQGLMVYRNKWLFRIFAPIMQHDAKTKVRNLHAGLQVVTAFFAALGLLFILANKARMGKSIVPSTVHSMLGTLALACVCVQVLVGLQKRNNLANPYVALATSSQGAPAAVPTYRWHGQLGLVGYDLFALAILTGMMEYVPLGFSSLIVFATTAMTWFVVQCQAVIRPRLPEVLSDQQGGAVPL